MTRKLLAIVALLFVLVLSGCGNQSGDIQQGPWYEAGKAESPGEPWPREILKEGSGPVTTPGSLVFITYVIEPDESKSESYKAEFIRLNQKQMVLWLGPPLTQRIVKQHVHSTSAMIGFEPHLLALPREVKLDCSSPVKGAVVYL